jgi:hypothetical protein
MWWRRLRYVLLLIALCAIATCPSAKRACTANTRSQEAEELLDYLAERVEAAIAANGRVPAVAAGPSPATSCCDQGGECTPDAAIWHTPAWQALAFSIDNHHRYTYAYVPDASGRAAVVRATGDLDCDGVISVYELTIWSDGTGVHRKWARKNPKE